MSSPLSRMVCLNDCFTESNSSSVSDERRSTSADFAFAFIARPSALFFAVPCARRCLLMRSPISVLTFSMFASASSLFFLRRSPSSTSCMEASRAAFFLGSMPYMARASSSFISSDSTSSSAAMRFSIFAISFGSLSIQWFVDTSGILRAMYSDICRASSASDPALMKSMKVFWVSGERESKSCSPLNPLYMALGSFSPFFHASVMILNKFVFRASASARFQSLATPSRSEVSHSSDIMRFPTPISVRSGARMMRPVRPSNATFALSFRPTELSPPPRKGMMTMVVSAFFAISGLVTPCSPFVSCVRSSVMPFASIAFATVRR